MSQPKWVVSRKGMGDGYISSQPGQVAQTTWNSRAATAAEALEEGALVLGLPANLLKVTAWGEIDWSDSGNITEMDAHGNYKQ